MANKTVNTKIQLRYDTLTNWGKTDTTGQGGNYVPLKGEVCIAQIDTETTGSTLKPVMFKVGDGTNTFANLDWMSAKAADVYSWAKKSGITVATDSATADGAYVTGLTWDSTGNRLVLTRANLTKTQIDTATDNKIAYQNGRNVFTGSNQFIDELWVRGEKDTVDNQVVLDGTRGTVVSRYTDSNGTSHYAILEEGTATAEKFKVIDGTSSQFLKADGSVDETSYLEANKTIPESSDYHLVTYDSKGLVTGSREIKAEDVPSLDASKITSGKFADDKIASATKWDGKQDKLTAGTNISISNNTISATDTTYAFAEGSTNGTFKVTPSGGTTETIKIRGLNDAAYKGVDTSIAATSESLPTSKAVTQYVAEQIKGGASRAFVIDSTVEGPNNAFNYEVTDETAETELNGSDSITTTDGTTISVSSLSVGDMIYTISAKIKDWFYGGSITAAGTVKHCFYQISGDTPVLNNYVDINDVTGGETTTAPSWGATVTTGKIVTNGTTKIFGFKMPANPDTHWTTGLYVGASNTKSNASATSPYLKLYDANTKRAEFRISGNGGTTVTSDANGNITISSTSFALPAATEKALGGIKLGYTETGKNYPVKLDEDNRAYVNVTWEDTNSWRAVQVNGTQQLSTGTSTGALNFINGTYTTMSYNKGVKVELSDKVLTTDDTLILNGGTSTTVI